MRKPGARGRWNGSGSPPISMTVRCKASSACRCGWRFCANSWSGISALECTTWERERQRIASDFHDGPLQSFISLQMRLEILRKLLERDFGTGMDDLRD